MTILHAAEQEGVMLGELESARGAVGVLDLQCDFGGHDYGLEVICYRGRVEEEECGRDSHTPCRG